MNVELLKALNDPILRAHADPRVRAVVLTGQRENFCAGGDVKTFAAQGEALPDYLREATAWLQIATDSLLRPKAPVVTGGHADAAGGRVCVSEFAVMLARVDGVRRATEILVLNPALTAAPICGKAPSL